MVFTEIFWKKDVFSGWEVKPSSTPVDGNGTSRWSVVTTHFLCGLVHALHGWSSAIVQEEGLLPVVVVGLQDVPAAELQVDPDISSHAQVRR